MVILIVWQIKIKLSNYFLSLSLFFSLFFWSSKKFGFKIEEITYANGKKDYNILERYQILLGNEISECWERIHIGYDSLRKAEIKLKSILDNQIVKTETIKEI